MKVAIIMGSISDFEVVKEAISILKRFNIETEVKVLSAHRTPDEASDFAKNADKNGFSVIIGAAGKAAHLPGVLAAYTTLPVIGLPIKSSTMDGLDSLLSIVQMPKGIPVATVAINGGENAGLLAAQILSLSSPSIKKALETYKEEMTVNVEKQNLELAEKLNNL